VATTGDPFTRASDDPFAPHDIATDEPGPPITYGGAAGAGAARRAGPHPSARNGERPGVASGPQNRSATEQADYFPTTPASHHPARQPPLNTYAVLTPIFGVVVPPAGVALGHLALPHIKRTGERGWLAAIVGLVLGYLLSAILIAVLVWLLATRDRASNGNSSASSAQAGEGWPSVVTSIAPPPTRPRHKLDWSQATVGKCAEIEKRDEARDSGRDDALDLYEVPCQHRVGVYTIVARVPADAECNSTYVAAPPDRSFAVCLNRY
jgi:hypothetical protein